MPEAAALLEAFVNGVIALLEAAAAGIILVAAARALWSFARTLRARTEAEDEARRAMQSRFARSLLLALDFTIGSDLLKVAQAPDLDRVVTVGLVVLVRVVLTFAIQYELTKDARRENGRGAI